MTSFRTNLFAVIIGLIGLWIVTPAAETHPMAGAAGVHAGHHQGQAAHHQSAAKAEITSADCSGDFSSSQHGVCCGASSSGCCGPCFVLPAGPVATVPSCRPIFASAHAETIAGLPPPKLKRPPRLAL